MQEESAREDAITKEDVDYKRMRPSKVIWWRIFNTILLYLTWLNLRNITIKLVNSYSILM